MTVTVVKWYIMGKRRVKVEKIVLDGETFYFEKGKLYDSSFIETPSATSEQILARYFETIDYKALEESDFLEYVKNLKRADINHTCLEAIEYGQKKFSDSVGFYTTVFPIITSCYRNIGMPEKAIRFWMENKEIFKSCLSVPLLTSLAAAYCDVGNYELALKCAKRAYALQGGSKNYATELSNVYHRINSALGRKYNDD